jgi:hypothetical protein
MRAERPVWNTFAPRLGPSMTQRLPTVKAGSLSEATTTDASPS